MYIAGIRVLLSGLTLEGVLNSWLLGTVVYSAFGAGGYLIVCLYFIFGTLVRLHEAGSEGSEGGLGAVHWPCSGALGC